MVKARKSWLARKLGMKKAISIGDVGVSSAIESLASNTSSFAFLDSSEVQEGSQIIGEGEYSLVHNVEGFAGLDDAEDNNNTAAENNPNTELKRLRAELRENAITNGPQQYAMKRLNKKYFKDKVTFKRAAHKLVNEVMLLNMLQESPNILSIRALNKDVLEGSRNLLEDFFVLTDRLTDTLSRRISCWRQESVEKGEAPNDDRIPMKSNYAFQMAKAVKACHDRGIMIRDLTPDNFGFKDHHTVQLFGLGHAKLIGKQNGENSTDDDNSEPLVGSRRYMDGHVWMTGEYLYKSDVYSWAIIFYEMISELVPYDGLSSLDHQQMVCARGQRPSLSVSYFPPMVDKLLTEAWDAKVEKRINSTQVYERMQQFLMDLDPCYYEQSEEDFLFDIDVKQEVVSNFGDDKWFEPHNTDYDLLADFHSSDLVHDDSSTGSYDGDLGDSSEFIDHFANLSKSKLSDASTCNTFTSSVKATKPKKLVSSAA